MNIFTKAVHAGDRNKRLVSQTPITTPIYTATSYLCDDGGQLDRILGREEEGYCYARHENPTNAALEALVTELERGHGALACSSGMAGMHLGLMTALLDRRKSVLCANAIYGATQNLLSKVLDPLGIETAYVDICNMEAVRAAMERVKPGCVVMESISNPLLRVGPIDQIAELCRAAGAALMVDSTFATPLLMRPIELGANLVVHSATKFLSGHGDALGGLLVSDEAHHEAMRTLSRSYGPILGPFESYLTMRGIKTFALRMERQCQNACRLATWLASHPRVAKVHYPADPHHPDKATAQRLLPKGLYGAVLSFEVKDAQKEDVLALMDRLQLIVRGTSLGDVHTMVLYPMIASHRDVAPRQRQRLGIGDNLLRISVGIEAVDDVIADLDQALGS